MIATTNRNLEESVARKEFRQDLYFRLNVVPIPVPPLRERKEDVVFLAEQFMQRFVRKHGVRVNGISPGCRAALMAHDWPGNVRELQNVIERAVILCPDGSDLSASHLGFNPAASPAAAPVAGGAASPAASVFSAVTADEIVPLEQLEKRAILQALELCKGNRTHAAKHLQISIRTMRNKLKEYGVSSGTADEGDGDDAA